MHRDNVVVSQPARDLGLLDEELLAFLCAQHLRAHEFERHGLFHQRVFGLVDDPHAALADALLDDIAVRHAVAAREVEFEPLARSGKVRHLQGIPAVETNPLLALYYRWNEYPQPAA